MSNNICHMKKLFLASSMLISTSVFAAETSSTATIDFSGRVTTNSCSLATESARVVVPLGEVSVSTLETQGNSSRAPFGIRLVGCDPSVSSISLTFQDAYGSSSSSAAAEYLISAVSADEQSAENIGVQINLADRSSTAVKLGEEILLASNRVSGSALAEQTFNFNASMVRTSASATPTPGVVRARATVIIRASTAVTPSTPISLPISL